MVTGHLQLSLPLDSNGLNRLDTFSFFIFFLRSSLFQAVKRCLPDGWTDKIIKTRKLKCSVNESMVPRMTETDLVSQLAILRLSELCVAVQGLSHAMHETMPGTL